MSHNRRRVSALCRYFALYGIAAIVNVTAIKAQQGQNILDQNAQINFTGVKIGSTRCLPLLATNTTGLPIAISRLAFTEGSEFFTLTDTVSLPIILSAGQSLTLGNLCFASREANKEYIGYISVDLSPKGHSDIGQVRIDATTEIDSLLLIPCLSVTFDSAVFGPVFYGGQAFRTMNVTNNKEITKIIRCIDFTIGDAKVFAGADNQFPLEIPPHQTRPIHLVFSPLAPKEGGIDNFRSKVKIESMDINDGCSPDFDIYGYAIRPTNMNTIHPFNRTSVLPELKMTGTDEIFGQTFLFQCTDSDSLRIDAISLDNNDPHFILSPMGICSNLPMVVIPGDYMAVRITLKTDSPEMYENKLRFVLGNGSAPLVFEVKAMRIFPQSGVEPNSPKSEPFTFSAIPNPSSGNIAIQVSGAEKADIEIFDALGKSLVSKKGITSWTWGGRTIGGISVPCGNYFIRAITHGAGGKEITKTKQVVIAK